jgi:PKD repeat protein
LTAIFDGSGSTDSDGSITSYTWNFGDGSSATGKTVTHTYTGEATFVATLQVTDNLGADGTASTTVTVQPKGQQGQKAAKLHSGLPWLLLLLPGSEK